VTVDGKEVSGIIDATAGKIIFNENIPQDIRLVDRSVEGPLTLEIGMNFTADKKGLGKIFDNCIKEHGTTVTAEVLDHIKALGYKYSTKGALTISVSDIIIPETKQEHLDAAQVEVDKITKQYKRGLISNEERYGKVITAWNKAVSDISDDLIDNLDQYNPIYMMATSGARGSKDQIKQLAGMRGLMADTSGRAIEIPIKANFREGLNVLEYFISTHGARKGLADTALRTADSGYLTRRLVDVSQDVIIRQEDCGVDHGVVAKAITDGNEVIEGLKDRLCGRVSMHDVINPETGEIIVHADELINEEIAGEICDAGITEVEIRSILTCKARIGVCAKCYGSNLASGQLVNAGEAVGIIAAQSIGEPGTQLTMRTFHTGGVAGDDITQGLPRVEELFEARRPKGVAILATEDGTVSIEENKKKREVIITDENGMTNNYLIPYGSRLKVSEGQKISAGDELTEGSIYPQDLLAIKGKISDQAGLTAVTDYLTREVQRVYRLQGIDINDKHIEVIVRQMIRKVRIEDPGDSDLLIGSMVDRAEFEAVKEKMASEGKAEPTSKPVLLGITKTALATDSFLSAASFQETTRVLTDAAIKGKKDPLVGLKENVIIGKLIPAGTGLPVYQNVEVVTPIIHADDYMETK
ncbi:MAG: DNA-directed RNA polymerase subunit beta', partial [Clostridia bacterium]|nr:DNA-directed RNA polymerase subunit beta' [Clostridia bacterium]